MYSYMLEFSLNKQNFMTINLHVYMYIMCEGILYSLIHIFSTYAIYQLGIVSV